ncbi:hypothetical protein PENSTE_c011G10254 [Penicillium steckii]|uniref:Uncharacterized protein n=1 Tax=Penicillium steckii TaxID=303698 RepID=A0A1V6T6L7_9EURO|nr:hypothetical protein PENSTE_c011G10254 [Penicillium steckii]
MVTATFIPEVTSTETNSSHIPLTTIFTPHASCLSFQNGRKSALRTEDPDDPHYELGDTINTSACLPSGWNRSSYFSPGLCPSGYYIAASEAYLAEHETTELGGKCCPTGYGATDIYTVREGIIDTTPFCLSHKSTTTTAFDPSKLTRSDASTYTTPTPTYAELVSIRWRPEDFATATSTPNTKDSLSAGQQAGIAVGVTTAASLLIMISLAVFCLRRSRSKNFEKDSAKYGKIPQGDEEDYLKRKSVSKDSPVSLTWNAVSLDTWFYEAIAIFFSLRCFTAMLSISVGTAAKLSLLIVVGECIAQLRWMSLQSAPRPLFSVQAYDSASRGPWGSIQMIVRDKCRSLVTLGASIIVLALAFDPFVQQIITYEIQNTENRSDATEIKQSHSLIPGSDDTEFMFAFRAALWANEFNFEPACPLGNCKWPSFQSVEMCSKCEDATAEAQLRGCKTNELSPLKDSTALWNVSCNISLATGKWAASPVQFSKNIHRGKKEMLLRVPNEVVWLTGSYNQKDEWGSPVTKPLNETYVGVENPLAVFGYVAIALDRDNSIARPSFEHPTESLHIINVTRCALSFCLKKYNISVADGIPSVQESEPDFGSFYILPPSYQPWYGKYGSLCWKPNSQPVVDWNAKPYAEGPAGGVTDTDHFQFCGFVPEDYSNNLEISGYSSTVWQLITDKWVPYDAEVYYGSRPEFRKTIDSGLEATMNNVALSLSKYARQQSKATVHGTSGTPESYVIMKWPWLTLPAVLITLGGILLVFTALDSRQRKTSLWKFSVLPFLYHGLEGSLLKRNGTELMSEMDRATQEVTVRLDLSDTEDRSILRGTAKKFPITKSGGGVAVVIPCKFLIRST